MCQSSAPIRPKPPHPAAELAENSVRCFREKPAAIVVRKIVRTATLGRKHAATPEVAQSRVSGRHPANSLCYSMLIVRERACSSDG